MVPATISVIIPCYNLGRYLDETVDSVFAQTRDDFEVIIVNDGSTDAETNRLLADYSRPRTKVITTANRGPGSARNTGIREARGEYVCALDADDKLHERFFEETAAVLDRDRSIAFVSCWLETFGEEAWIWKQDRCDLVTLLDECTVATPALVRREALLAVGGFDEDPRQIGIEDWDLWIQLAEGGFIGRILPEVLFYYRRRANSLSHFWMNGEAHLDKLRPLIEKHGESYRRHLLELVLRKEVLASDLLRNAYQLEHDIECRLEPLVQRKQEEIDRLRARRAVADPGHVVDAARLTTLERENRDLREAVDAAHAALAQFAASRSWRMTAPLRRAYDLWHARSRAGAQPPRS